MIMKKTLKPCLAALALSAGIDAKAELGWGKLPPLPPAAGQRMQPGVAGPFAGVHGDVLFVAGGANFPEKLPWEGGAKVWWEDVWVLEGVTGTAPRWVSDKRFALSRRLGYGVSVDTPEGVIVAGGHDADRCYAEVYLLFWDAKAREVRRAELPPMPEPLSFMAGALVGRTLYVAGGQKAMKGPGTAATGVFWALDLARRGAELRWEVLPSWPGPARVLPVAAAQRGPSGGEEFFLFSGRLPEAGKPTRLLSDAYAFDPATRAWRVLPPVSDGQRSGLCVMAGAAVAGCESEVLIFGGDRGELFLELEAHDLAIAELRAAGPDRKDAAAAIETRLAAKRAIYAAHPGFAREVLAFDTKKNAWRVAGRVPGGIAVPVTTVAAKRGAEVWLPSGEIKPGIRTPEVVRVRVDAR